MEILQQYLITFGWAITGAVSMAISLGILVKVFSWITTIYEWQEINKGNLDPAIVLSSAILGTALVIALTIMT